MIDLYWQATALYDRLRAAFYAEPDGTDRERRLLRAMGVAYRREMRRAWKYDRAAA